MNIFKYLYQALLLINEKNISIESFVRNLSINNFMEPMKYVLIISCSILITSCINKENSENKNSTIKVEAKSFDKALLDGIWAESEEENANFYIKNDSMYFIEETVPCFIELSRDTLITHYDGLITHDKIVKLDKDSLILYNEAGNYIKLKRRK
jgi:hypothetical protein